jgi:hypothetical protein
MQMSKKVVTSYEQCDDVTSSLLEKNIARIQDPNNLKAKFWLISNSQKN